ncbi:hypothetical protein BCAR13_520114 [Paraburkholderia caribensis]|nr:hypothetical protein BCAR13_520114 [Paraburkholderia caribensis]
MASMSPFRVAYVAVLFHVPYCPQLGRKNLTDDELAGTYLR